mgnify:CR=1 FL=1
MALSQSGFKKILILFILIVSKNIFASNDIEVKVGSYGDSCDDYLKIDLIE